MRSVKGLAILAYNFLHATQVAAIFIALSKSPLRHSHGIQMLDWKVFARNLL